MEGKVLGKNKVKIECKFHKKIFHWKLRGCLDLVFSITHHSVFIIYNSKLVCPMAIWFVWICFQFLFPSLNSLIFEWWVMEIENNIQVYLSYENKIMTAFW